MDEFELRLKNLLLSKPSEDLRGRIFGRGPDRAVLAGILRRPIRLGWAVAFALAIGLVGFFSARLQSEITAPRSISPEVIVEICIVESGSNRNDFDLTKPSTHFLSGDLTVGVEDRRGI